MFRGRWIRAGLAALAVAGAAALAGTAATTHASPGQAAAKSPVKIAIIYSRTGPLKDFGAEYIQGFKLGLKYLTNGKNVVNGHPLQIFYGDDQTNPANAVALGKQFIGAGVKILGDSHGPVRIGARVQILENAVLHLLPDNELVLEDGVVIGPGAMIHGCHIGRGTVVEPAAIVCDFSAVGAESLVRAGTLVKQRSRFPARAVLEGFPAEQVGTLEAAPDFPNWGMRRSDLATLSRRR
jgi:carbonic anhydrase/acetyltransferase-like protein (isoleucine patch superfamily)